jgi:hypothetical protein
MIAKKFVLSSSMFLAAAVLLGAHAASAANAVPQATLSDGGGEGGSNLSDGITPAGGEVGGGFVYGGDAGIGTSTQVIDWQLPAGVSLAHGCDVGFGDLCILVETDCDWGTADPATQITASGSKISLRLVCEVGEGFGLDFLTSTLNTTPGVLDMSLQFKTTTLKRTPKANNMWQIKIPQSFFLGVI